jgi:pimeloyl-ACP methyl ester carboxylesterase
VPNAELHVFERSAHMTFVEEPDVFRAVVARFLSR